MEKPSSTASKCNAVWPIRGTAVPWEPVFLGSGRARPPRAIRTPGGGPPGDFATFLGSIILQPVPQIVIAMIHECMATLIASYLYYAYKIYSTNLANRADQSPVHNDIGNTALQRALLLMDMIHHTTPISTL